MNASPFARSPAYPTLPTTGVPNRRSPEVQVSLAQAIISLEYRFSEAQSPYGQDI